LSVEKPKDQKTLYIKKPFFFLPSCYNLKEQNKPLLVLELLAGGDWQAVWKQVWNSDFKGQAYIYGWFCKNTNKIYVGYSY